MEASYEDYRALKIERSNRVLRLTIDRPEAKNAINEELHTELSTIFSEIDRDDATDVVVLSGAGNAFCAGGDLAWIQSMRDDIPAFTTTLRRDKRIQNSLLDLEKPMIARVVGPAIGLGCSLALFSDFVYATPDARFADPHVSVGLVAGDGGSLLLPQLIGYMRAKKYLLTGDPISGAEAAEMGLITEAVEVGDLDATVDRTAAKLVAGASQAIRWTKASINAGLKQVANAVLERAAGFEQVSQMTEDHGIALEAFLNKERPQFKGR